MEDKVIICFFPGSSGNFISAVCQYIKFGVPIKINENGSAHNNIRVYQFLSDNKFPIEEDFIKESSTKSDCIICGHFKNLKIFLEKGSKVIFISFTPEDASTIIKNSLRKTWVSEVKYQSLAGADWPNYSEFLKGNVADEFLKIKLANLLEWYWIMPSPPHHPNLHEIKFSDITNNIEWVDFLVKFLGVDLLDKSHIYSKIEEYKIKQP